MSFTAAEEVAHSSRYQCLPAKSLLSCSPRGRAKVYCHVNVLRVEATTEYLNINTPTKGNSKMLLPFVLERKEIYEKISP